MTDEERKLEEAADIHAAQVCNALGLMPIQQFRLADQVKRSFKAGWAAKGELENESPCRVPLGSLFNRMTSLASSKHGTGLLNGVYKEGFEDCFALVQAKLQQQTAREAELVAQNKELRETLKLTLIHCNCPKDILKKAGMVEIAHQRSGDVRD